MIDTKQEFVAALQSTGYDVYYEAFYQPVNRPCITYKEVDNFENQKGDTLKYSKVSYQIKLYVKSVQEMDTASSAIDEALDEIGYDRYFTLEDVDNNDYLVKVFRYEADVREYLN